MNSQRPTDALANWPEPFAAAEFLSEHAGFSGARIWKIAAGAQPFALRMWPAETLPAVRLRGLHRFLRFLSERGLTAFSVPVPARNNETAVAQAGRLWQLEPWLPGRADFHDEPSDARLRAAMTALAQFHRTAAEYAAAPEHAEWFAPRRPAPSPAVSERLQSIDRWRAIDRSAVRREIEAALLPADARELLFELWDGFAGRAHNLRARLTGLQPESVALHPVLRDVWHDHLLFTGDELTGIVDPSACRTDHPAVDLARLLGSLLTPDDAARRAAALSYYEAARPMSATEHRLLQSLEATQFPLAGLTWIERLTRRTASFGSESSILPRLALIADRIRRSDPCE